MEDTDLQLFLNISESRSVKYFITAIIWPSYTAFSFLVLFLSDQISLCLFDFYVQSEENGSCTAIYMCGTRHFIKVYIVGKLKPMFRDRNTSQFGYANLCPFRYQVDDYQLANYNEVGTLCVFANSLLFVNINANGM